MHAHTQFLKKKNTLAGIHSEVNIMYNKIWVASMMVLLAGGVGIL
jgi:hypothetical protein